MILTRYGENGVRIKFGDAINLETHEKVRQCYFFLKEMRLPDIIDITPAFTACLIRRHSENILHKISRNAVGKRI